MLLARPTSRGMRNIRLLLEYDGTHFCGWQFQPNVRTVQGELEKALKSLLQEEVRVSGSGRTDVGVHALAQVANFHTANCLDLLSVRKGLNSLLPEDIVVLETEEVNPEFHARFNARGRKYHYVITRREKAVGRFYSWYIGYDLDVGGMKIATQELIGEHDFKSFCQSDAEVNNYKCIVTDAEWKETSEGLLFEITANRFLHSMVRIIVGTLVEVGRGKINAGQFKEILEVKDRTKAGKTAPAKGLFLVKVYY